MSQISLTAPVRSNLVSLQQTAQLLAVTQERLSTGKKVNSAIDDPQAFFTAASLNHRAADLSNLLDNAGQAIQTIKAADSGIEGISGLLKNAKATLIQAQDTKISGSSTNLRVESGSQLASAALDLTFTGTYSGNQTLELTTYAADGSESKVYATIGATDTVDDIANTISGLAGLEAEYSGNTLTVTATNGRDLTIKTGTYTPAASGPPAVAASFAVDKSSALDGTYDNGTNRDSYVETYNNLLAQIDQLAADASYKGINLLTGDDLTVYFNEDQTSSIEIKGANLTINGDLDISDTSAAELEIDTSIISHIAEVDKATSVIRAQASEFGTNLSVVETRSDFTKHLINTLNEGSGLLVLADTNEESANLLALQTRQQLSTVSLSLASQADQAVLRLF